jgi:hypothetical protein
MKLLVSILFLIAFTACVKDQPSPDSTSGSTTPTSSVKDSLVYVVCEGNYGSSNAAVSLFNPSNGDVVENYYRQQNGIGPGDVAQSLTKIDGLWYLVMNNSAQVIICDSTFKKVGAITGLKSPRYLCKVGSDLLYISDLYDNCIVIASLQNHTVIGKIPLRDWSEQIIPCGNQLFVGCPSQSYVYVVDTRNNKITDSVFVGKNLRGMALNKKSELITLSYSTNQIQKIKFTNTNNLQTIFERDEKTTNMFSSLTLNRTADTIYLLGKGVSRMDIDQRVIQTVFSNANSNYYGIGCSPNNLIYIADAHDYSQRSTITVMKTDGTLLTTFKAGVNANSFAFN